MLDFAPDGLDEISQVTAYLAGTAVVTLGMLVAIGLAYFLVGRNGGTSKAQERGMKMVGIGLASVMLLTSISAAVSWGISQGGASLMPEGSQQQDLVVEREGSAISCDTPGSWEAPDHEGAIGSSYATWESTEEGHAQLRELGLYEAYADRMYEMYQEEFDMTTEDGEPPVERVRLNEITWHRDAANGGCEPENTNLMPGTVVTVDSVHYPRSITTWEIEIPAEEAN